MATWNRTVTVSGGYLVCGMMGNGTSNPAPVPGKGDRSDSATDITVYSEDRTGGGAKIKYHASGCTLTRLTAKANQTAPPCNVTGNGNLLTITDTGATGAEYEYYVDGKDSEGNDLSTEDPQIHNAT